MKIVLDYQNCFDYIKITNRDTQCFASLFENLENISSEIIIIRSLRWLLLLASRDGHLM